MNDVINREDAIDAVLGIGHTAKLNDGDTVVRMSAVNYVLRNLPSAQPEKRTDTHACDLIDRQAAQTELMMKCERYTLAKESHGMGHVEWSSELISVSDAMNAIRWLPSTQTERKKGHWVEIGDEPYDEWECDRCGFVIDGSGCIDPEEYRDVYNFCPNCGADMRKENT